MHRFMTLALIAILATVACSKQSSEISKPAQIVGWNNGACATCGGFYVNFSNDTSINSNTYYALNYPDALLPTIERYYDTFHQHPGPIAVFVDSASIQDGQFHWIRVTNIRDR